MKKIGFFDFSEFSIFQNFRFLRIFDFSEFSIFENFRFLRIFDFSEFFRILDFSEFLRIFENFENRSPVNFFFPIFRKKPQFLSPYSIHFFPKVKKMDLIRLKNSDKNHLKIEEIHRVLPMIFSGF